MGASFPRHGHSTAPPLAPGNNAAVNTVRKHLETRLRLFWVRTRQWKCWVKRLYSLLRSVTSMSGNRSLQDVGDTKIGLRSASPPSHSPGGVKLWALGVSPRSPPTSESGFHLCPRDACSWKSLALTSQLPREEGFKEHSLPGNEGAEVATGSLASPCSSRPRRWLRRSLSAFDQSLLGGGAGARNCVRDSSWPQAAQRLMRENTHAQEVMLGDAGRGGGAPRGAGELLGLLGAGGPWLCEQGSSKVLLKTKGTVPQEARYITWPFLWINSNRCCSLACSWAPASPRRTPVPLGKVGCMSGWEDLTSR